jgi:hypothetical protein
MCESKQDRVECEQASFLVSRKSLDLLERVRKVMLSVQDSTFAELYLTT